MSLEDLKEGDTLIYIPGGYSSRKEEVTAVRTTKAQVICKLPWDREVRFWKKDGYEVGANVSSWTGRGRAVPPTPELLAEVSMQKMLAETRKVLGTLEKLQRNPNFVAALPHLKAALEALEVTP